MLREVQQLAQGHTADKELSWNSNSGMSESQLLTLTSCHLLRERIFMYLKTAIMAPGLSLCTLNLAVL
mgnify:CR=1 FL=1